MNPPRSVIFKLIFVALTTTLILNTASADSDHDRARSALISGEVLALRTILERLESNYPGQVLEVELERERDRWVYELKILQPDGKLLRLDVDGATGTILKQRVRESRRKP